MANHPAPPREARTGVRPRLAEHEGGGIIIVTLFAASFIFGLIVAVHGIGHAIHAGDAKRDAADSTAYSTATLYAHAMNQVALLNMAKITTLSILSAHSAMLLAIPKAVTYASDMGLATLNPAYGIDVIKLGIQEIDLGLWMVGHAEQLLQILKSLEQAQEALRTEIPRIALQRLQPIVPPAFPDVRKVFFAPEQRPLPIQAAPVTIPCARIVPSVTLQAFAAFKDLQMKDVAAVAAAATIAEAEGLCLAFAAATGSTKEISAPLGKEPFQLRGYAVGGAIRKGEEEGVRVATWRENEAGGQVVRLRDAFSQIGVAQAEFYYDGNGPQTGLLSELLFSMKWRARVRRYRDADGFAGFRQGCTRNGGGMACGIAARALQQGQELIVH